MPETTHTFPTSKVLIVIPAPTTMSDIPTKSTESERSSSPLEINDLWPDSTDFDKSILSVFSTSEEPSQLPQETAPPVFEKTSKKNKRKPTCSRRPKKPKGTPKRPLSAYNLFFQSERRAVIAENSTTNVAFEDLGRIIGSRWKVLDNATKMKFEKEAQKDSLRYRHEMELYNQARRKKNEALMNMNDDLLHHGSDGKPLATILTGPPALKSDADQMAKSREIDPQTLVQYDPAEMNYPIPPGTEVFLPDQHTGREVKYRVSYKFYTMTQSEAEAYMEELSKNWPYGANIGTTSRTSNGNGPPHPFHGYP